MHGMWVSVIDASEYQCNIQTALTATVLRFQQNDSNRFLDLLARVEFQLATLEDVRSRCKGKVEPPHMAHGQSKLGAQEFLRMATCLGRPSWWVFVQL